jgi:hypothetical protein
VNGGRNYNGPKVRFASLSKIWLFAGKSEYPTLHDIVSRVKMRWVQIISRKGQWEHGSSAKRETRSARFVKGHDFSRAAKVAISMGFSPWGCAFGSRWNPQRLYARFQFTLEKIQSELHGDMQRVAEMSTPFRKFFDDVEENDPQRLKPRSRVRLTARLKSCPSTAKSVACGGVTELSEIPCRVSSDLHEWRNESATVLPTGTANL